MKKIIHLILIIISNLIPLIGIFFLNWDAFSILFAFWLETLIITFFNYKKIDKTFRLYEKQNKTFFVDFLKIRMNNRQETKEYSFVIPIIIILSYGILIAFLFLFNGYNIKNLSLIGLAFTTISLLSSYLYEYLNNFIFTQNYNTDPIIRYRLISMQRFAILHITIICGGLLTFLFNTNIYGIILLIIINTAVEIYFLDRPLRNSKYFEEIIK
jgi:hypothetical protein